jgi:prephenate dehydratase
VFVFDELVMASCPGKTDQAVMAIENSIAGPIIPITLSTRIIYTL